MDQLRPLDRKPNTPEFRGLGLPARLCHLLGLDFESMTEREGNGHYNHRPLEDAIWGMARQATQLHGLLRRCVSTLYRVPGGVADWSPARLLGQIFDAAVSATEDAALADLRAGEAEEQLEEAQVEVGRQVEEVARRDRSLCAAAERTSKGWAAWWALKQERDELEASCRALLAQRDSERRHADELLARLTAAMEALGPHRQPEHTLAEDVAALAAEAERLQERDKDADLYGDLLVSLAANLPMDGHRTPLRAAEALERVLSAPQPGAVLHSRDFGRDERAGQHRLTGLLAEAPTGAVVGVAGGYCKADASSGETLWARFDDADCAKPSAHYPAGYCLRTAWLGKLAPIGVLKWPGGAS